LFSISQDGALRVAGDVPVSPFSYSLIVAATDSGTPASSNYASITIDVANAQLIASGDTLVLPSGSHRYESLRIEGTLRLTGDAALEVSGSFVNQGVLDIINWNGTLPSGLVNEGVILDHSDLKVLSSTKNGSSFDLTVPGYTGHLYQLKTAADLSGPWVDSGELVAGTGTPSAPHIIPFSAPVSGDRRFYRVFVTSAP
jgi:hypothetical protein